MGSEVVDALFRGLDRLIDKIGIAWALIAFLVVAFGIALILRRPGLLAGFAAITNVVLTHRRETRRINDKVKRDNQRLALDLAEREEKIRAKQGRQR